jgi:hypothetical protein
MKPPLNRPVYRMAATAPPYARPEIVRGEQCTKGAFALIDVEEEQRLSPIARSQRSQPNRKPLKMVAPERAPATTVSDLLANRWQTAVADPSGMQQAGYKTRPVLLVCG